MASYNNIILFLALILFILYFFTNSYELFTNLEPDRNKIIDLDNPIQMKLEAYKEIDKIKDNYYKLKELYDTKSLNNFDKINLIKNDIKSSTNKIDKLLLNSYDRYRFNNIVYNDLLPILDKPDNIKFIDIINDLKRIIDNGISTNYNYSAIIREIRRNFNELNEIYINVYFNKIYTYTEKRPNLDALNKMIYDLLIKLTDYDDLSSSGIILILNTTLKRSYEIGDKTEISSNIRTFEEKVKKLAIKYNVTDSKTLNNNVPVFMDINKTDVNISVPASIMSPTTSISIPVIKEDFNKIYNAFDIINAIYISNKNIESLSNSQKKQITNYNQIIYSSLANIANYDKNNKNYYDNVISITNIVIKPILEEDLYNAYSYDDTINEKKVFKETKDELIQRVKNRFYDAMIEIKNLILTNYSKSTVSSDKNKCFKDIIDAIISNNYPIKVNELKNCDKSIFNDENLIINPKIAISKNYGKTWDLATDIYEYKKTGYTNNPYLYSYKLAGTINDGKDWKFIYPQEIQ